ncbi:AraC family transcriptional regulator [Photobacterium sanguinicancri]|uniref:AraC family transcriptional regulator n=1 Tax=Photobacterium sanguinicancri TaxID=875932 RepID=UPI0026E13100|nr:helix-turn-helix domain-containing protein [Photobacterium sanguinicancri]MDO6496938.1 AraC family transcriptional regulator [Photobacterium sanguinicancri]
MKTDYHLKLKPVIRYLEKNYNTPLNLENVARMASLSPYHFHRIFKAVTDETLNEYLRRLRLQKAARDLFYNKPAVIDVALESGFSSSQSFAKAFRKYFNMSPTDVRNCPTVELFSIAVQNSKVGHQLSKNGNDLANANSYTHPNIKQRRVTMERKQFQPTSLAYVRVTGSYGENYEQAIGKLYQWAGSEGVADATCIFIYHDNPELTPVDKCRTDICLMVSDSVKISGDIELQSFAGGEYATSRTSITNKQQYEPVWNDHISQIVELGLEMEDRPCFELYHSYDAEKDISDISFCSAIK